MANKTLTPIAAEKAPGKFLSQYKTGCRPAGSADRFYPVPLCLCLGHRRITAGRTLQILAGATDHILHPGCLCHEL